MHSATTPAARLEIGRARYEFVVHTRTILSAPIDQLIRAAQEINSPQESVRAIRLINRHIETKEVVRSYIDQRLAGGRSSDNQRTGMVEEWITETDDSRARALLSDIIVFKQRLRDFELKDTPKAV